MSIRYFATNRNREDLGRDLKRLDRIALQEGGYHFVNMEAYMSHYLAEVESKTMPKSAIVQNSQARIFDEYLQHPNVEQVVVCVHGFNVSFHDAQTWYGILTDSLRAIPDFGERVVTDPTEADRERLEKGKNLVAFIGFSWPSNGSVLSYPDDQREAIGSAGALANLIARIRSMDTKPSVSLICHSMGNFLACHMFKQLVGKELMPQVADERRASVAQRLGRVAKGASIAKEDRYLVDRYIMLAPDVERRHVTKCVTDIAELKKEDEEATYVGPFYSGLEHLCGRVHNFYSRFDGALAISNIEKAPRKARETARGVLDALSFGMLDFLERNPDAKWEQRLGATQHAMMSPPNMISHNAVELSGREIGHSDYVDSRPIVEAIAKVLSSHIPEPAS